MFYFPIRHILRRWIPERHIAVIIMVLTTVFVILGPTAAIADTSHVMYGDTFGSGWRALTWNGIVNVNSTESLYAGVRAIRFETTAGWAGLDLRNDRGVDATPYTHVRFAMRATQAGQRFALSAEGAQFQKFNDPIPLVAYGGDPTTSGWSNYDVPLADLRAANQTIHGIVFHDWTGDAQPAVFIDEVLLVRKNDTVSESSGTRLYFVSKRGGNGDGLSWSSAWNELDQIRWGALKPGDVVTIDGGESSMTYRTQMDVQKSGTASAPITVRMSSEAGRSGKVNIDGGRSSPLPFWGQSNYTLGGDPIEYGIRVRRGTSWVTIDGSKWRGIAIYGTHDSGIFFEDATTPNLSIYNITMRNIEVYDTGRAIQSNGSGSQVPPNGQWYSEKPGIRPSGESLVFERMRVHDNGEDAFQVGTGGVTNLTIRSSWIFNTRFKSNGSVFNSERHPDGLQIFGGTNDGIVVDQSVLGPNLMQPLILGDTRITVNNVSVTNTLVYGNRNAIMNGGSNNNVTGWRFINCTVDMSSPESGSFNIGYWSTNDNGLTITGALVTGTGGQYLRIATGGLLRNNSTYYAYSRGDSIPGGNSLTDQPYATSGVIGSTSLTADYRLKSDSALVGKGSSITSAAMLGG